MELYEQELPIEIYANRFNDTYYLEMCDTAGERDYYGSFPIAWSVEVPASADMDVVIHTMEELFEKINAHYNTSLTKLKMKMDIRGD